MSAIGTKPTGPFAILRIDKIKSWAELNRVDGHNARVFDTAHVRPSTSPDTHVQLFEVGDEVRQTRRTTSALIKDRLTALSIQHPTGVGGRAGTVLAIEVLLTASPEFFAHKAPEWIHGNERAGALAPWIHANVSFLMKQFGRGFVSYAVHLDEDTPHLHAIVCPVIQKQAKSRGRPPKGAEARAAWEAAQASAPIKWTLSARDVLGADRQALGDLQDAYAQAMQPLGIARGKKNSPASHKAPAVYRREMAERAEKAKAAEEALEAARMAQAAEAEEGRRALLRSKDDLEEDREAHRTYLQSVSAEQAGEALRLREMRRQLAGYKARLEEREQEIANREQAWSDELAERRRVADASATTQQNRIEVERTRVEKMAAEAESRARELDIRGRALTLSRQKAAARIRGLRAKVSAQSLDLHHRQNEADELHRNLASQRAALDDKGKEIDHNRQQTEKELAKAEGLAKEADTLKASFASSLKRVDGERVSLAQGLARNEQDRQENARAAEVNAKELKRLIEKEKAADAAFDKARAAYARATGMERGIEAFVRGDLRYIRREDGGWRAGFGSLSADAKEALRTAIKPVLAELATWISKFNARIATLIDSRLQSLVTPEQIQAAARDRVKRDDIRAAAERAVTPADLKAVVDGRIRTPSQLHQVISRRQDGRGKDGM